jgi:hypothetical protein
MKEQIEGLLALDTVDRRLLELEKTRRAFPAEREEAEGAFRKAAAEHGAVEEELRRSFLARRAGEAEVDKNTEAIGRLNVQLNLVKTQREYDALRTEMAALRERNDRLADDVFAEMDRAEALEKRKAELARDRAELEETARRVAAEVEKKIGACEEEIAHAREERAAAAALVEPALLARYERIRSGKEGMALAEAGSGACGLCYRSIPPQRLIEIRSRKSLLACEGCGRILVAR